MIDNFEIIKNIISEKSLTEDNFFFLQCLRRRKDVGNEDMTANNIVVDEFFIADSEDLEKKKSKIIKVCNMNNARAYIRLNKRSYRTVGLRTMALIAETIANNNYQIRNTYSSACGRYAEERTFLLDIDYADVTFDLTIMKNFIRELLVEARKYPMIFEVPTKNGFHLITPGFNTQKFGTVYPTVGVHKDNPTILYIPDEPLDK